MSSSGTIHTASALLACGRRFVALGLGPHGRAPGSWRSPWMGTAPIGVDACGLIGSIKDAIKRAICPFPCSGPSLSWRGEARAPRSPPPDPLDRPLRPDPSPVVLSLLSLTVVPWRPLAPPTSAAAFTVATPPTCTSAAGPPRLGATRLATRPPPVDATAVVLAAHNPTLTCRAAVRLLALCLPRRACQMPRPPALAASAPPRPLQAGPPL